MLLAFAVAVASFNALRLSPASVHLRPALALARTHSSPVCQLDENDEIDALDTSDSWESQMAEQRLWQVEQVAKDIDQQANLADWAVDEGAHLGLGDDAAPDEDKVTPDTVEDFKQKLVDMEVLNQVRSAAGGAPGAADNELSNKRVLTSLESVIGQLIRLDKKLDALTSKVDKLAARGVSGAAPAAPAAPAVDDGGWDGDAMEGAYFDYDDDDPLIN